MLLLWSLLALQDSPFDQLVSGLRSDCIEERERATGDLRKLGGRAVAVLKPLIDDPDAEVAWRARTLITPYSGPLAGELFLQAEERLLSARTVQIRFRHVANSGSPAMSGELLMKGDRVRSWVLNPKDEHSFFVRIQSDGKRLRVERGSQVTVNWRNAGPPLERDAPAGLGQDLLKTFLRVGMLSALSGQANYLLAGRKADLATGLTLRSQRLKFLGDRSSLLQFSVQVGGVDLEQEVSVQPGSGTLSFRRMVQSNVVVARETYEEFLLDRDLPDDLFELPK